MGMEGAETLDCRESLFLPTKFSKATFVQLVLRDASPAASGAAVGVASIPLHQALRCLEVEELQRLQRRITKELDDRRFELQHYQREVDALKAMVEAGEAQADAQPRDGTGGADRP